MTNRGPVCRLCNSPVIIEMDGGDWCLCLEHPSECPDCNGTLGHWTDVWNPCSSLVATPQVAATQEGE